MRPRKRQRRAKSKRSHALSSPPAPTFDALPPEVRVRIYELFFEALRLDPHPNRDTTRYPILVLKTVAGYFRTGTSQAMSLLITSKTVHSEAYPVFCQYSVFKFTDAIDFANDFLRQLPATNLQHIRHVTLDLDARRLDSKTFRHLEEAFSVYTELRSLHCFTMETTTWASKYRPLISLDASSDEVSGWCPKYQRSLWALEPKPSAASGVATRLVRKGALKGFNIKRTVRKLRWDKLGFTVVLERR